MSNKRLSVESKVSLDNIINESSEASSTDLINTLPSECLANIFMCLGVFDRIEISKVCRHWKEVCDNFAWYDIKKFVCRASIERSYNNRKMKHSDMVEVLFYCGRYLQHLKLSTIVHPRIMPLVGDTCLNLTHLEIHFDYIPETIDEAYYTESFIKLINLRSIKILHFRHNPHQAVFPSQVLDSLPEEVNEISLIFDEIHGVTCDPFYSTLEKFHGLRTLDLERCIVNKNTMQEIAKKTTIVKLSLNYCRIKNEDAALIFDPINLETLHLKGSNVSKECILRTVNNCKNIKTLEVDCDLSSFDVKQITQLKNLTGLYMSCKNISNVALQYIDQLKELEHLSLVAAKNVDDNVIISISKNCNKVKHFELINCTNATALALRKLSKLKNLEVLLLDGVENFEDDTFTCIVSECKNIKSLKLISCKKLTEVGLQNIVKMENLKILYLCAMYNISDAIFNGIYKLESLSSYSAVNFTPEGAIMLLKNCPNLEKFSVFPDPLNNEVLLCAIEETSRRTNNTLLTIDVHLTSYSRGNLVQYENLPPLLKLIEVF